MAGERRNPFCFQKFKSFATRVLFARRGVLVGEEQRRIQQLMRLHGQRCQIGLKMCRAKPVCFRRKRVCAIIFHFLKLQRLSIKSAKPKTRWGYRQEICVNLDRRHKIAIQKRRVLNQLTLIQNQNCALIMKAYLAGSNSLKKENLPKDTIQPSPASFPMKTPLTPIILKQDSSNDSASIQKQKGFMEQLCLLFLQRIGSREEGKFEAKDLLDDTPIKKRRIYDLMNILEGCGFVRRISKGTYYWKGFQAQDTTMPSRRKSKESTSISTLAAQIKTILLASQDPIDFKDIVKKVLDQTDDPSFNLQSIKRRIYECCKVLKVLGLIEKKHHAFFWIRDHQVRSTTKSIKQHTTSKSKRKAEYSQRTLHSQQKGQIPELMIKILDNINTEDQLNSFILNLRGAFLRKLEQNAGVKRQLKYE